MIPHLIEFRPDGGGCRQLLVRIALLFDELTAHLWCGQAGIETVRFELWVRLALTINDGSDIAEQVGQMFLRSFATSGSIRVHAGHTAQEPHAFLCE